MRNSSPDFHFVHSICHKLGLGHIHGRIQSQCLPGRNSSHISLNILIKCYQDNIILIYIYYLPRIFGTSSGLNFELLWLSSSSSRIFLISLPFPLKEIWMREMGIKQKDDSRVVVASTDCDGGVEFMGGFCHLSQYRGLLLAVGSPWLQHFNLSFNLFLLFGH